LIGVAKTVRWVQYEAAGFVRIEVDEDGWDTEITKVVTANDTEELHRARDDRGHFRVYDETFEPAAESESSTGSGGRCRSPRTDTAGPRRATRRGTTGSTRAATRIGTPRTTRTRATTSRTTARTASADPLSEGRERDSSSCQPIEAVNHDRVNGRDR
jgi:hypothetical protein